MQYKRQRHISIFVSKTARVVDTETDRDVQ